MNPRMHDYSSVTELPGTRATQEQLARLYQRYHVATQLATNKRVFELACGAGLGLGYLLHSSSSVVGGDYTEKLLRVAQSHYCGHIPLVRLDGQYLPFHGRIFDLIVLFEAIYYFKDVDKFVVEARRLLKTKGTLLIGMVNKDWSEFAPSPFSTRYFSVPELRDILNRAGFTDLKFYGAFPVRSDSFSQKLVSLIRRWAIAFHMMPGSLEQRARFKRLFYGTLICLPAEVSNDMTLLYPLEDITADKANITHKIIYCTATCP